MLLDKECKDNAEVALVGVCWGGALWDGITIACVRWCGGGEADEIEFLLWRMVLAGPPFVDGGSPTSAGVVGARERERDREAEEGNPTGDGECRTWG